MVTLLPSAARTASGVYEVPRALTYRLLQASILLNVSAAALAVGDTLDVFLQSSSDGKATWDDFVHFNQVLGNGGAKKYAVMWAAHSFETPVDVAAPTDGSMPVGANIGPRGADWRVKWTIAGATPSFTFGITADVARAN